MSRVEFEVMDDLTSYSAGAFAVDSPSELKLPAPVQLPEHLRLPPSSELTPPPSPPAQSSPPEPSVTFKLPPLLSRASSVISKRDPRSALQIETGERTNSPAPEYRRRKQSKTAAVADFFHGSSELVSGFSISSSKGQRVTSTSQHRPGHSRAGSSFSSAAASLFTPRSSARASPTRARSPEHVDEEDEEDEILQMDLEAELFPDGSPSRSSPIAFDELRSNAERLFMRMQIAYQTKSCAVHAAKAARRVDQEELEEARMRADHLKLQLDDMSAKVAEREDTIHTLSSELAAEKQQREMRQRTVRLVDDSRKQALTSLHRDDSGYCMGHALDSGEDSSEESAGFWSRPATPSTVSTQPDEEPAETTRSGPPNFLRGRAQLVADLREENDRLKVRVAELEETVEGCLGLVGGL